MQVFSPQTLGVVRSSNACPDCESSTSSKLLSACKPSHKKTPRRKDPTNGVLVIGLRFRDA
jgi:hypothetical protein